MDYSQFIKSLMPAFEELRASCNELGVPEMLFQNGVKLYKQCIIKGLTRGRSRKTLVNACLLVICELFNYPLLINELVKASSESRKSLLRYKLFLKRNINLPKREVSIDYYISRFACELGLKEDLISKSLRNVKLVNESLINKSIETKALTAIYLACSDQGVSIRDLARASGKSIKHLWKAIKEVSNNI